MYISIALQFNVSKSHVLNKNINISQYLFASYRISFKILGSDMETGKPMEITGDKEPQIIVDPVDPVCSYVYSILLYLLIL